MRLISVTPILAAVLAITLLAAPAAAVTINEGSFAGGDFSNAWASPTIIGNGYDTVTGATDGGYTNNNDMLAFTGLAPGAQQVTLTFTAPSGIGWSYIAGGSVLFSTQPFRWGWDGSYAGAFVNSLSTPTSSVTINLDSSFGGALYLGIYAWGQALGYSVSVPGNAPATPAPVPLPAAAGLLGGALAGLGALSRRRAKRAAS
jgi:hypothetical protein